MSQPKSVEQQLKEAIEASKQTLALSEQVTSLAAEKDALSKRLAEIETSLAPKAADTLADSAVIKQLAQLVAERESHAKQIAELKAQALATQELVAQAAKAGKGKADLNEYVRQRREDGEEGTTPAEKINDSGKAAKASKKGEMPEFIKEKIEESEEAEDEACGPGWKKGKKASKSEDKPWHPSPGMRNEADAEECEDDDKKAKKASKSKAYDGDFGDLTDDEVDMIKQYRRMNGDDYEAKKGKKADSELSNPTKEDSKDFDKQFPQPGLNKNSKKVKGKAETDVEEIIESPDMQEKEDESDHTHEKTLSKPEKGAKKAENSIGGVNKQDVVGQPDQDEEESIMHKKDSKKGKKAEEAELAPVAEETAPAPESGQELAALDPVAAMSKPEVKASTIDTVIDEAVSKFAAIAAAKKQAEAELSTLKGALAAEISAKTEAHASIKALSEKFDALMGKVAQIEASDKSVEMKAAKMVAATASEPVVTVANEAPEKVAKTDSDILAEFEAIKDKREQNKFFHANRLQIERAATVVLKGKKSS